MTEAAIQLDPPFTRVKHCTKCCRIKPLLAFYTDKTKPDGLQSNCITCRREKKGYFVRFFVRVEAARSLADQAKRRALLTQIWPTLRNPIDESWHQRKNDRRLEKQRKREARQREASPERFKAKQARYVAKYPDKVKARAASYRANNREADLIRKNRWKAANPERVKASVEKGRPRSNKQRKKRHASDPLYALKCRIRSRTAAAFKNQGIIKTSLTADMIGCDWEHLKRHIQKQFTRGMHWANRSEWHIDHIVPLASARDEDELIRLAHFSNLRPMWATENILKADTIVTCQPELAMRFR